MHGDERTMYLAMLADDLGMVSRGLPWEDNNDKILMWKAHIYPRVLRFSL